MTRGVVSGRDGMDEQVREERQGFLRTEAIRSWFARTFPAGPTPVQEAAWPTIDRGEHTLIVSPTGTGKTLAAFLAIVDRLACEQEAGTLRPGLRCVYLSPLRSLGYDIERNLTALLLAIRTDPQANRVDVRVAVRTGDTSVGERRRHRDKPPHLLITTPESLALLLSQPAWLPLFARVEHVVVDEIHALVPTKRGADLAVSIERLAALTHRDPCRVGLSATCRPTEPVARYLVGPTRTCRIIEADDSSRAKPPHIGVESLLKSDEAPHRGLTYRRLLEHLHAATQANRTTVVFANTRAFAERITHDLRHRLGGGGVSGDEERVAVHHSALDAGRRREVEEALKLGRLRAVVTSTSLELGVDIGTADLAVLVGLPGSVSRCLQRIGRAGHQVGAEIRGLILAATPAELIGAAVTARAARRRWIEPLRSVKTPLDVLCQQLVGMACAGDESSNTAFELVRRTTPFEELDRADFEACLAYLSGQLAAPAGAFEPEPGAPPRWTAPRLWSDRGWFGIRHGRVPRWLRQNIGTILSEETIHVRVDGRELGTLEAAYAERLQPGDRFVLDGRALQAVRLEGGSLHARATAGEPELPRWLSDRQSLSAGLARAVARFRVEAGARVEDDLGAFRQWLADDYGLDDDAAGVISALLEAQRQVSEIPDLDLLLIEESPHEEGFAYTFHAPLSRSACEALGRALAARIGRGLGQDLGLTVADLGWSIRVEEPLAFDEGTWRRLLDPVGFREDVMVGLDRGELPARRFRAIAATALMVLKNPDGRTTRVGGLHWVSQRLYPLVRAACPGHPLLAETRREILEDGLDSNGALAWLAGKPNLRFRRLDAPSPFAGAWIDPAGPEPLHFESPESALRRLHARLTLTIRSE